MTEPIWIDIDSSGIKALFRAAPSRFARAFTTAGMRALKNYRGFHRKRRMSRKSTSDRIGVFATRKGRGIKQDRWFPVRPLGQSLDSAGAELTSRNLIVRQLEFGAVRRARRGRAMAVPFSKHQMKGKPKARLLRLLKAKSPKVFVFKTASGRHFIVERKGRGRQQRFEFLFHFQERVRVPPRLEYVSLFARSYRRQIVAEVQKQLGREIARMNK